LSVPVVCKGLARTSFEDLLVRGTEYGVLFFTKPLSNPLNMEKIIAYCGLMCAECPTFLATQANDDAKRKEVAELWSKHLGVSLKPQDINCDGCLSEQGRIFGHCKVCEIRKCAREKKLANCAYCDDYACKKLDFIFNSAPAAKKTLDEIKKKFQGLSPV